MTIGIFLSAGLRLISQSESSPAMLGMLRSSRIRSGRGEEPGSEELAAPPEVVEQFLAVLHEAQLVAEPRLLQRLLGQQAILGVVIRHQDQDRFGIRRGGHRAITGAAGGAGSP